jgi:putative N6-adenine-specific DNA methylase
MASSKKALERRIKQHVIAREHRFFAVVQPGFEDIAGDEIREILPGVPPAVVRGGVEFSAKLEACYRVNLCSRTATRVIMRIADFKATYFTRFRRKAQSLPWELYLQRGDVRFNITSRHSRLYHTGRIEEELAGAVAARLKEYGIEAERNVVGDDIPAQEIFARFEDDICTLSLDSSGTALYRRGYKTSAVEAPLRETTAAAILRAARSERYDMILDPMCGSGTFGIEAALVFSGRCPGVKRGFAFQRWPAFHRPAYDYITRGLTSAETAPPRGKVYCSDIDAAAAATAKDNADRAGLGAVIAVGQGDFLKGDIPLPPAAKTLLVLNPPYGVRIGDAAKTAALYRRIGAAVRRGYGQCGYAIIVPGLETEKALSLRYDRKILFVHGGIKVAVIIRDGY